MPRTSLPLTLQMALKHHLSEADIREDEEVQVLMNKLSALDDKLVAIKAKVKEKREQKKSSDG